MACKSCASDNQTEFNAEINVHFPGTQGLNKPAILLFPKLMVCLDCGFAEFGIPANELQRLNGGTAASRFSE